MLFRGSDGHLYNNYVYYKETPRMKLLQLRNVKPYLFNSPIPINENIIKNSELYKTIFKKELNETMAVINTTSTTTNNKEDDNLFDNNKIITGQKSINITKINNFLNRIRNSQTVLSRKKKKKNFITSSVVVETDYLKLQEVELFNILERKRSLHPKVKIRVPVSVQVDKCELLIQIVGAKNVPLRSEIETINNNTSLLNTTTGVVGSRRTRGRSTSGAGAGGTGGGDVDAPIVSEHMLDERKMKERRRARSFVEVKFQENVVSTVAMDGGTPMWRESLSLPFRAPQEDYTPSSLEQVREEVYFTLFDEVVEDDSERGGG